MGRDGTAANLAPFIIRCCLGWLQGLQAHHCIASTAICRPAQALHGILLVRFAFSSAEQWIRAAHGPVSHPEPSGTAQYGCRMGRHPLTYALRRLITAITGPDSESTSLSGISAAALPCSRAADLGAAAASGKEDSGAAAGGGSMLLRRHFVSSADEHPDSSMEARLQQLRGSSSDGSQGATAAKGADLNIYLLITFALHHKPGL